MKSPVSIIDFLESAHIYPNNKKILVTSFITLQHTHFASELQIVEELLNADYNVAVLQCDSQLSSCFANITKSKSNCLACVSTNKAIYKELQSDKLSFVKLSSLVLDEPVSNFSADLEQAFENGSYHSTIAFTKDAVISSSENIALYSQNIKSSRKLYAQLSRLLQLDEISAIITFNGRFSESRVCLEIGKRMDIPTFCHETSGTGFRIFSDGEAHGREYHKACVSELVENLDQRKEFLDIGESFLEKQRNGGNKKGVYSDRFSNGSLPDGFIGGKHNISIFLTSEDEQSGFDDWAWPFGNSQYEVIDKIIPKLLAMNYVIWIRVHPNLAGRDNNSQVIDVLKLKQTNVHIIAAEDSVDSYALISESSNVIVFGSTIGLEATYMGINTILLGRSLYEHLDVNRTPASLAEIPSLLNLAPSEMSRTNAILVAAYFQKEYNHFSDLDLSANRKFLTRGGVVIKPRLLARVVYHLLQLFRL